MPVHLRRRLVLCGILLLILLGWLPRIGEFQQAAAAGDFDMFLAFYEAVRKTIAEYGQFPFWNPWHFGGAPLFANPQLAIFGLETPLILLFGTVTGLHLAMLCYSLLGGVGMWFFLGRYCHNDLIRGWGCLIFSLCGCHILASICGVTVMTSIMGLPWMLFFLQRLHRGIRYALGAGLTAALLCCHSLHYLTLVVAPISAIALAFQIYRYGKRKIFLEHLLTAALLFVTLAGYRIWVTLELLADYPRTMDMRVSISFWKYLIALLYPGQGTANLPEVLKDYWIWCELGCYVGLIASTMWIISWVRERSWWHWGFLLTSLLTLDSSICCLPGSWLRAIPPYTSFFAITRWRFAAIFFLAVGAVRGMEFLWGKCSEKSSRRWLAGALALSLSGLLYNAGFAWISCRSLLPEKDVLATVTEPAAKTIRTVNQPSYSRYASIHNNLAQLFAYEPLFGYRLEYHSKRLPSTNRFYEGEITSRPRGAIAAVRWTPNRIEIDTAGKCSLWINQNPGNYWRADGAMLGNGKKAFEVNEPFILPTLDAGTHILTTIPPSHESALLLTSISGILLLIQMLRLWKKKSQKKP